MIIVSETVMQGVAPEPMDHEKTFSALCDIYDAMAMKFNVELGSADEEVLSDRFKTYPRELREFVTGFVQVWEAVATLQAEARR